VDFAQTILSIPHANRDVPTEVDASGWRELDPWWDVYIEAGHETAVDIAGLLEQSNEAWRQSTAPFDTDPLAAPLTQDQVPHVPDKEEEWSDWLATVLRPSETLVTDLFEVGVTQAPDEVSREVKLRKEGDDSRRADLLLLHTDQGISVEVKIDNENYGKTEKTTLLAERHYDDYEWYHTLLLPKQKTARLSEKVDLEVSSQSDGRPQVDWDNPGPITVVYWRDVTATIRTLLRRGDVVNDHWAANAYLLCAAVEQHIMDFQPQPVIEEMADPTNVVDTSRSIALTGILDEQHSYLSTR